MITINKVDLGNRIEFEALEDGKRVRCATCYLQRFKSIVDTSWSQWEINWSSSGSGTYEEKYPELMIIQKGFEELKKLNSIDKT